MDGEADGNLYGTIYDFHDVTIAFASSTVNVKLALLHYLLGKHVYIPGAFVQPSQFTNACLSFATMYAATQKKGAEVHTFILLS